MKTNLESIFFSVLISLSMSLFICSVGEADHIFFKGDTITIGGEKYTLDIIKGSTGIWKSTDGKFCQIEIAKRKDNESYILTEVILAKDSTVSKRKSSFEIGEDYPKHDPDAQLQQVALIQKIVNGIVLDRIMYRGSPSGYPVPVTGLIYYFKGDIATFAGKKVTLDRFEKEKAIWKGIDNKYYVLEISKDNQKAEYVLKEIK